ncbi:hypothetical protein [Streptomyces sp. NPDC055287]
MKTARAYDAVCSRPGTRWFSYQWFCGSGSGRTSAGGGSPNGR